MKKIFTLIAAALMAVGASAQMIKWDAAVSAADLAADASWKSGNFKVAIVDTGDKMSIDGNNTYFGTADDNQKFTHRLKTGGKSSSTNQIIATIPSEGKLNIYVRTGSGSATDRNMIVTQGTTELFNKVIKENEATDYVTVGKNKVFPVISVPVTEGDVAITYPQNGLNFYAFEFISATAATDPVMTASPTAMSLAATPSQNTQSKTFTITGANLTPGTYNLTVPNLAGLSVNPTSFTVGADGKVSQEVTVTYTSTEDVAKASANITATVGDLTATVAVNYQSRATAYTQATVTEDATWDWSALTETVQLTDETSPKKGDEYLLADVDDRIDFKDAFGDATALVVDLEYPSRAGYAQGNAIKFKTNRAGKLAVDFSNTGGSRPYRYLRVNGTSTTFKSATQDKVSATEIEVPAGEVVISGYIEDATDPQTKDGDVVGAAGLRFYKVVFTATGEPEDPTGINTVATDAAKANVVKKYVDGKQVVIEKNGKKYNVAGAQIK